MSELDGYAVHLMMGPLSVMMLFVTASVLDEMNFVHFWTWVAVLPCTSQV